MATFDIPQLKEHLPILKSCYGFDEEEVSDELMQVYMVQHNEGRYDKELASKFANEKGHIDVISYVMHTDDEFGICATEEFYGQVKPIVELCCRHIKDPEEQESAVFVLILMAAIFNRDLNNVRANEEIEAMKIEHWRNAHIVRPDLLRLFIALNKSEQKYETPIKISFKTDSPHLIQNKDDWFSDMLNDYIKQKLGNMTVEEAEEELAIFHSDEKESIP